MNKIIEINAWELAAVAGGCHCHCFLVPPNRITPATYIGVRLNENECGSACTSSGLEYSHCSDVAPVKISFTEDEILKYGKLAAEINREFRGRYESRTYI